ncbi:MAG: hypothetical protein ACFE8B_13745 [Candidatus Hermodarchaeota archaeon]
MLRVKNVKIISKGGPIPTIMARKAHVPYFLIVLDYGDIYRLYSFSKDGTPLYGKHTERA